MLVLIMLSDLLSMYDSKKDNRKSFVVFKFQNALEFRQISNFYLTLKLCIISSKFRDFLHKYIYLF